MALGRPKEYRCWASRVPFGRSEKAFRIRRFMPKFLGVSLMSSASKKGRTWEHGPGTPYKLLSSHSFFRTLRAFGKGVLSSSSLGCSFSVSEAQRSVHENTRHAPPETPFLKLLFRTPDPCFLFCVIEHPPQPDQQ